MTSRFVPAGSTDEGAARGDDWDQARQDVEDTRRRKEEEGRQEGGKSLYEVLQQNKGKSSSLQSHTRLKRDTPC